MRVYVALLASALFITAGLAGCSGKKDKGATDAHSSSTAATPPVLLLNVTIGNRSYAFSSAPGAATPVGGSASMSGSGHTSGSASASVSGSASGSSSGSKSGSASGSSTGVKANATLGNATGNTSIAAGKAPLNVTFGLAATNLKTPATAKWTFDFGRAGGANATKANATGKGNATATSANGTKLPTTLTHTYLAQGDYNVTFILRVGNATPQSLRATLHILANATAANGTATKALPAETHFEFGESLGCTGDLPIGNTCIDWQSGPPGSDTDGHWIPLGEAYWGLMVSSTIGTNTDSDCAFTDADGNAIGDANNGGDPCGGAAVPDGSEYLFIYSYAAPATSITVDFAPA